jgi:hypothetical protein
MEACCGELLVGRLVARGATVVLDGGATWALGWCGGSAAV